MKFLSKVSIHHVLIVLVVVIIILAILNFFLKNNEKKGEKRGHIKVCFDERKINCINAETAKTLEEKTRGLMYRDKLGKNEGMLFIYENERENLKFWMKNMNFPIDIIWLNKEKEIIYIHKNLQPCSSDPCQLYSPKERKVMYVLEVNANFSNEKNLSVGDKVFFKDKEEKTR